MCFPEKGCVIFHKDLNLMKKVYFWGGNGEVKREQSQTCLDSAEQVSHLKA